MADNRSVLWVDAGDGATITLLRTSAGAATIKAAMLAVSNSDWLNDWEGTLNVNGSPAPVAAQYQSVTQQATLTFLCADNTIARLNLVAPKISVFLSDGVTVDSTAIAALIAACVGNLLSTTLSPAVSYLSGILTPRRA